VQVSNDAASWTDIYSTTNGNGGIDDLSVSGNGRYVRMYGTTRTNRYAYSLYEFEVYGGGAGPAPDPTPVSTDTPVPTATPADTPVPTGTPASTITPEPGGNLALNRSVVVSGNSGYANEPESAVDGNTSTRWASAWEDPSWIYIDLGASYNINRVVLNWHSNYGVAYQIQVSDDASSWTDIYSTTNGNGGIDDHTGLSGSGRYVRMYGTQRTNRYAYSLYEFEVYGN
jgi:hypothetical protein